MQNKNKIDEYRATFTTRDLLYADSSKLLSMAGRFGKVENEYVLKFGGDLVKKKIAVLGSITTHYVLMILKLFLYRNGISPVYYEGEYDSVNVELIDQDSGLYRFAPEILIIFTYHTDIKDYPQLFSSTEEVASWVDEKATFYEQLWASAADINGCQIFQTLFVSPVERQLGNLEANYHFSRTNCVRLLNLELVRRRPANVLFIDAEYAASYVGKQSWFDYIGYYTSKQGFSLDSHGIFCHMIARLLAAHVGKVKKCLVLDLDNTLWGGVIGDDGIEGINLDPHNAVGEAFISFQKYVKLLKDRGVILAVCSKNNEDVAKSPFIKHSDMHLRLEDIPCFVANWDDKATNIRSIAGMLNIGLDSLVFFDDNPAERDIVKKYLPEVEVIDVPEDPAFYIHALEKSGAFEWVQLSREDLGRSATYITDKKRKKLQEVSVDYDDYLKSLAMTAVIREVSPIEMDRFVQLINKSNQFNLRTKRYSEAAIKQMRQRSDEFHLLFVSLADKFAEYGIISSVILQKMENALFIDTLVMSCRVLKRGVENAIFNAIVAAGEGMKCEWIVGEYLPTKKNEMVSGLYASLGFEKCPENWFPVAEKGGVCRRLIVSGAPRRPHLIRVNINKEE